MADVGFHVPISTVTNPILLYLFNHGWESPGWGHLPINQAALGLALHGLSEKVADRRLQAELQQLAHNIVDQSARAVVGTAVRSEKG
ncbi:hypothetical protein ABIC35_000219 [Sphingomonas trueperi]